jgi:hypothetical protein
MFVSANLINLYPVKYIEDIERSEFNRGYQPLRRKPCAVHLAPIPSRLQPPTFLFALPLYPIFYTFFYCRLPHAFRLYPINYELSAMNWRHRRPAPKLILSFT